MVTGSPKSEKGSNILQGVNVETRSVSGPNLDIPSAISVLRLSKLLNASGVEVIKQLMRRGVMANINQVIDFEIASVIASDFGFSAIRDDNKADQDTQMSDSALGGEEEIENLVPRAPIVTILGHVDHGKTTLLDVIRNASVTSSEKGGITQHIGAYQVKVTDQPITFLDTPGHKAFTAMRARGARVTDIAILVVAADDGVMPQTREAIDHAKAADVPIVVAINKMDVAGANTDRVQQQLSDLGLIPEQWGGDTIMVPLSAKTQEGVQDLLENIVLVAEVAELKANPNKKARGIVVEAKLDSNRGPVATVLVQDGTLQIGDTFTLGETKGKVRALFNYQGQRVSEAGPTVPVEVLGIENVPKAGQSLVVDEPHLKNTSSTERHRRMIEGSQEGNLTDLGSLMAQVRVTDTKELNIILKTDVEGSGEALRGTIESLASEEVAVKIIRNSSGLVTENDVLLASAAGATIVAFNTKAETGAKKLAALEDVGIRYFDIIYDVIDYVNASVSGLLDPVYEDVIEARASVKEVFEVKGGTVAGIGVTDGRLSRNAIIKVVRGNKVVHEGKIKSLRHFKDNVREVVSGTEGGIGLEEFDDFELGDSLEAFRREPVTSPPI